MLTIHDSILLLFTLVISTAFTLIVLDAFLSTIPSPTDFLHYSDSPHQFSSSPLLGVPSSLETVSRLLGIVAVAPSVGLLLYADQDPRSRSSSLLPWALLATSVSPSTLASGVMGGMDTAGLHLLPLGLVMATDIMSGNDLGWAFSAAVTNVAVLR